ncbi:MAG: sugar ABC transporter substrate-binding protein [Firmicutes bacterium]|nr:sugar ABC transporter substrate-binding protein [Bacillota bacterium]
MRSPNRRCTKTFIMTTIILLLSMSMVAGAGVAKDKITIGIAIPYIGQEFWADVAKGVREAVAEHPNVKLIYAESHQNPTEQIGQIESFIAAGVDVILLPPADPTALAPAVREAKRANIPVIGVDTAVVGEEVVSLVASNNLSVGRIAGKYIAKQLNGKGDLVVIGYPQHEATRKRVEGLKLALKDYPGIRIITEQVGKLPPDTYAQAEDILTAYPKFDAVFGVADVLTIPFWKAAKDVGRNKEIIFVGVDATGEAIAAIKEKSGYAATVAQQPVNMGRLAVETALKVVKGERVDKFIEVPTLLVTIDNVNKFVK